MLQLIKQRKKKKTHRKKKKNTLQENEAGRKQKVQETFEEENDVSKKFSSLCGPSASLSGRSFHANTNALIITGVSNNGSFASSQGRKMQVHPHVNSSVGVRSAFGRTRRRVLTSGNTADTNSVASPGTSYTYSDLGDCDRRCRYCGASFWYVERLKGHSHNQTPEYHLCCGGEPPRFLQLYIYDTDNKVQNRMHHFGGINSTRDKCREVDISEFKIWLYNAKGSRGYELPTSNALGAMVFENGISDNADFDVINQHRDGPPQRVNKLHPSYMSLQFPLLFIYSQPGLQQYDLLFRGGRLFQQYVVSEMVMKLEEELSFLCLLQAVHDTYVVCRVFEQKIQALIAFLRKECIFGDVIGVLYTVEFQKRGLPHCHTLLWVDSASIIRIAKDVDRFISAELPDAIKDLEGYNVISELMMHGPCGAVSLKAPCMKGEKCSKKFIKIFNQKTFFDENGHLHYRRRDTNVIDEIQNYVEGRFICAHEAYWKILKFDIHRREPAVQILAVHLEDMHRVTFRDQDRLESMVDLPGKKSTTLTEWFAFNEANEAGRHLSYLEF
nr:DNA helicase [Tanacetum cinerariifolium]